jgi:hypothetical protein
MTNDELRENMQNPRVHTGKEKQTMIKEENNTFYKFLDH